MFGLLTLILVFSYFIYKIYITGIKLECRMMNKDWVHLNR